MERPGEVARCGSQVTRRSAGRQRPAPSGIMRPGPPRVAVRHGRPSLKALTATHAPGHRSDGNGRTIEAGPRAGADAPPGLAGGDRRAGLDGDGDRRHDRRRPARGRGDGGGRPGKQPAHRRGDLRARPPARARRDGLAGTRRGARRRDPAIVDAGSLPRPGAHAALDAPGARDDPPPGKLGHPPGRPGLDRALPPGPGLEHRALPGLRGVPALLARGGDRQADHLRDGDGEPGQLRGGLGVRLRPPGLPQDGRGRLGLGDLSGPGPS